MSKGLKWFLIIGGAILAVVVIVLSILDGFTGSRYGGYGMMGGYGGWMGLMGLFWLVVVGLIIWAVVSAAHRSGEVDPSGHMGGSESALEILKKRYARGEINKAEYEEKKKDLT